MEIDTLITWPPPFTLKKNPRSRHIKIKATAQHGLELIVPMRFNQRTIPEILETNKAWITKQLQLIQAQLRERDTQALPETITLPLLNQVWRVVYLKSDNAKLRLLSRPQGELVLFGNVEDKPLCKKLLAAWVKKQAKKHLPLRLEILSQQTGLSFSSISIRNQRSRWGSCSTLKAINLSYKLLFLPVALLDHIMIHELCHTVHMNHSGRFWRLVAKFDGAWKKHSYETRSGDKFLPLWASEF